ncbi:MAG: hypothetical protein ACKVU0_21060 [Saprospiraceae bacterium]
MKTILVCLVMLHSSLICLSQNSNIDSVLAARSQTLVCLTSNYPFNPPIKGGSAFIVFREPNEIFLVTATHVVDSVGTDPYIIFQNKSGEAYPIRLREISHLPPSRLSQFSILHPELRTISMLDFVNVEGGWVHHSVADLSVLKLDFSKISFEKTLDIRFIKLKQIPKKSDMIPLNGLAIVFGYPKLDGIVHFYQTPLGTVIIAPTGKATPNSYQSESTYKIVNMERADTRQNQDFILLEDKSIVGYSGGPVFEVRNCLKDGISPIPEIRLIGVVHGNTPFPVRTMITPIYYLWDLIK